MKKRNTSKLTKIKGIVFDLDNTLYSYEPAHKAGLVAAYKKYPIKYTTQQFLNKFNIARSQNEKMLKGVAASHNRILYFQRMLEADNCFTPQRALDLETAYWVSFIDAMVFTADTKKTLLRLVHSYKLGILSDLTCDIQFSKLSAHRLWPFFDAVVTSEEVGVEKPNPKGLRLLLSKMGLQARDVVFVGDNPVNDGLVAKKLGIPYIQILRNDMRGTVGGVKPLAKIKKNSEVLTILSKL